VNSLPAFRTSEGPEEEVPGDSWDPSPLCDVTLVCGDFTIRAHKCVLAARSALFASYMRSGFTESKSDSWLMDDTMAPESTHFKSFWMSLVPWMSSAPPLVVVQRCNFLWSSFTLTSTTLSLMITLVDGVS
jgi:hypothetical protein